MKTQRRKFDDEYKREAVERLNQTKITQTALACELGISHHVLGRWKKEYDERTGWARSESVKERELEMVKKDKRIRELEMENDFLKKASAYFARLGR